MAGGADKPFSSPCSKPVQLSQPSKRCPVCSVATTLLHFPMASVCSVLWVPQSWPQTLQHMQSAAWWHKKAPHFWKEMDFLVGVLVSTELGLQPALQPFSFRLNPWVPSLAQPLLLLSNCRQAVSSSCLPATKTKWKGSPFSGSPPITSFSALNFFPVFYLTALEWIALHSFPGSVTSP